MSETLFNLQPRIEALRLANGQVCHVIDDALTAPERVRAWAVAQRDAFRNVDFNAYPGTYLLAPDAIQNALREFFVTHLRRLFDARRVLDMHCRYSMVTLPPERLSPRQRLCHRDSINVPMRQSIQASVLYLFEDASLGGTSFFEPARGEHEAAALFHEASMLSSAAFERKYAIGTGYMTQSNPWFRQIGSVPARWNRMIFYDGSILHSGDIAAPDKLSDDPACGRLTLNGFFTCRRNAS